MEQYLRQYAPDVELAIAFEHASDGFKEVRNGTIYYPICKISSFWYKVKCKLKGDFDYAMFRPYILRIIEDYKPDVIHCFGSEWPWGIVAEETNTPVIIHMQGYMEVYHLAADIVISPRELGWKRFSPLIKLSQYTDGLRVSMESRLMKANKYFMGRTQWDYNLVNSLVRMRSIFIAQKLYARKFTIHRKNGVITNWIPCAWLRLPMVAGSKVMK